MKRHIVNAGIGVALTAACATTGMAQVQQVTGTLGAPDATTISNKQLPAPDPKFGGVNDEDYKPPFPLTARLNKLTIKVNRPKLTPEDIKKLEGAQGEALDGTPLRHGQAGPH
jgi:hypothetical protein